MGTTTGRLQVITGPMFSGKSENLLTRCAAVDVSGLCVTYDARPFEPLPSLMAVAEDVVKLTAVCAVCGADAAFHHRIHDPGPGDARRPMPAHVGGTESYQARCRHHLALPCGAASDVSGPYPDRDRQGTPERGDAT